MAFTEINPATGKVWSREELFTQLRKTQAQLESSRFISWDDQLENLQARWGRHLEEWALATADTRELGTALRGWWEQARKELSQPLLKS